MPILMFGNQPIGSSSMSGIPVKPITQAEYDAISDEQKNSETAWLVTDAEGEEGGSSASTIGEIYSSEEIRIGVWKDGKPLYRKVFDGVLPTVSASWVSLGVNIPNAEVVKMETFVLDSTGNQIEILPTNAGSGASNQPCKLIYTSGDVALSGISPGLSVYIGGYYTSRPYIAILEYTKTTDTPMGSIPTLDATSLEIYDAEERVIGTWFGKPLYQKVYQGVTPSDGTNNVKVISFDNSTIDKVINFDGKILTENGYTLELNYCNGINPAYSSAYTQVTKEGAFMTMMQAATRNQPMFIIVQYTKNTD